MFPLKQLDRAISENHCSRAFRNFLKSFNLIISSTKRNNTGFVTDFNLGETNARTINSKLINNDFDFSDKSVDP
jgi:hypothetical protein